MENKNWEKEFDKKFVITEFGVGRHLINTQPKIIKDFILKALEKQKQEIIKEIDDVLEVLRNKK